jgi:hypothetical protein
MNDTAYAYQDLGGARYASTELTRGPWSPDHQHAGPPSALVCRAVEQQAGALGLTHISRLTTNLLRPVPLDDLQVRLHTDYAGKNAAHFSGSVFGRDKEVMRFTALAQRNVPTPLPGDLPGHPLPRAARTLHDCTPVQFPFAGRHRGYADLVQTRSSSGKLFDGPCLVWFCMNHPLVAGEAPSPYQRTAVAADSGNGISAVLDYERYLFVNSDLTIHWLRQPQGHWVALDAATHFGPDGCGLAQSALYDEHGLIGHAAQSLSLRQR